MGDQQTSEEMVDLGEKCRRANATSTAIAVVTLYLQLIKDNSRADDTLAASGMKGGGRGGTSDHLGASV